MNKLTVIGDIPNTNLSWEKYEHEVWLFPDGKRITAQTTDYLLVMRPWGKRTVLVNLDMGQLVALRVSIDALVMAKATEGEREE